MARLSTDRVLRFVVGAGRSRRALLGSVLGVLILASGAFLLGIDIGLTAFPSGWIVVTLGLAVVAGVARAGLGPTTGSLWLISLWWFTFPPLVGYLTGDWTGASRYTHPRMQMFAYTSAHAELVGGLSYALKYGLLYAVVPGTIAYTAGTIIDQVRTRLWTQR